MCFGWYFKKGIDLCIFSFVLFVFFLKRKRTPQKVEKFEQPQRTPLKRQRNPVKLFQSPAEQEKNVIKSVKSGAKEEVQILYKKGSFLALRGDDGQSLDSLW